MRIRPLNDWAVIRPAEAASRTAGGIIIPETAKERPAEGIVEAIGPGAFEEEKHGAKKEGKKERKFIPTTVRPGDRVLYERYAGQKVDVGGEELVLVREKSIFGTLPPESARPKEDLPPLTLPHMTSSAASPAPADRTAAKKTVAKPKSPAPKKAAAKKAKKKR